MNIRDDIKQLKTTERDLRKFGLMVGGVLVGLGSLFLIRHKAHWPYFLWPGTTLMALGLALPRSLKWIYIAWMSLSFAMGFVMAHVILTMLFYLIITPVGLIAKLAGKDFLNLKLDRAAKTYWLPRRSKPGSAADYERQF